jgi:hypothetical protein
VIRGALNRSTAALRWVEYYLILRKATMKTLAICIFLGACSFLQAQDIGRSEPPYVEATVTMPTKQLTNAEKRVDMVSALADKSEMNYRLLSLTIMEKWQASIKKDKGFLKNLMKYKTAAFTVHKDGTIEIKGVDDKPAGNNETKP